MDIHSSKVLEHASNVFTNDEIKRPEIHHLNLPKEKDGIALKSKMNIDRMLIKGKKGAKRKKINEFFPQTGRRTRWPNNIVPYELDQEMRRHINFTS